MKQLTMILAAAPVAVCTGQQVAARFHVPVRNSEGRDTGSAVTRLTGPFLEATRGGARMFQDMDIKARPPAGQHGSRRGRQLPLRP